ncbi:MAG: ABC transporter ATP-binding protein [Microthrixaceae bacterium]
MTASLIVERAVVRFGDTTVLHGVSLDVSAGDVVAVLGPSGSGKSTLLRAIAGLQPLAGGRVVLAGRDLEGVAPHRRGVGLMFQEHALFPHRDVAGNIGFGLRMQNRPPKAVAARVDELLDLEDLVGFGGRDVGTLSGGEQQRVALARALAPEPAVLLLDEPLGALDRTLREQLTGELRSLFTQLGLTVVAVTHDQAEAFSLADQIVLLDEGQVLQVGPPALVWDRPTNTRAAHLLGFTNIVEVQVAHGRAATPWGEVPVGGADGPATVLIRPAAVQLTVPGDGVPGTVTGRRFMGDRTALEVAVDGAPPLDALAPTSEAPPAGMVVHIRLDADGCVTLGR